MVACAIWYTQAKRSYIYILRDCYSVRQIWKATLVDLLGLNFFTMDLFRWVVLNLKADCNSIDGFEWATWFVESVYLIWQARNQEVFSDIHLSSGVLGTPHIMINCDSKVVLELVPQEVFA